MSSVKYIYILGSGHSGSTLLELLISNQPGIFALGEIVHIGEILKRNGLCSCGQPIRSCSVWSQVFSDFSIEEISALSSGFDQKKHTTRGYRGRYLSSYPKLLKRVQTQEQCNIFTDSSKFFEPLALLQEMNWLDLKIIYLTRHVGGVANSFMKKGHRFLRTALGWLSYNAKIQGYLKNCKLPWIHLEYEEFVNNPKAEMEKIFNFLNEDFEAHRIHNFNKKRHLVEGNRLRMKHQELLIRAPDKWEKNFRPLERSFLWIINFIWRINQRRIEGGRF